MIKADKEFIGHAVLECTKKGVKVLFDHKEFVLADQTKCSGFFDEDKKELHVATRKPQKDFFPVFVHEFCHFQQWSDREPLYMLISAGNSIDKDMWDWLNGKDISIDKVEKSIRAYQKMEMDCEKRVVRQIEKFGLSIEINNYIQMANIYVLFYSLLLETRKLYKTPPNQIPSLVKTVPTTFIESFEIPEDYRRITLKKCF